MKILLTLFVLLFSTSVFGEGKLTSFGITLKDELENKIRTFKHAAPKVIGIGIGVGVGAVSAQILLRRSKKKKDKRNK